MFLVLERVRWLTALLVLVGHMRSQFLQPMGALSSPNLGDYLFYFFTGFGHQAVLVFFVVSGFLVAKPIIERGSISCLELKRYYWRRFIRIYPTFIGALIMSLFLLVYFSEGEVSSVALIAIFFNIGEFFSVRLQNNLPLWSLSFEWIYYLLFPIVYVFKTKRIRLLIALITLASLAYCNVQVALYSVFWYAGVFIKTDLLTEIRRKIAPRYVLLIFCVTLVVLRLFLRGDFGLFQFVVNLVFCSTIVYFLDYLISRPIKFGRLEALLSRSSYSLYITHYPLLILIGSNGFSTSLKFVTGSITVYFVSFLFYWIIERFFLKFKYVF